MAYSVTQIKDRIGIGRETLRFYEQRGLINPQRKEGSSYRVYTDFDGLEVLRVKMMQSFKMSLDEIHGQNAEASLGALEGHLAQVEMQLQTELVRVQTELARIRKHRSFVSDAMNAGGVCDFNAYGGIYKLMLLGEEIQENPEMAEIAAQWIAHMPVCDIGWQISLDKLVRAQGKTVGTQVGLMVLPHFAEEYHLNVQPPVYMFPTGHCIRMMIKTQDPFHVTQTDFKPLFDYAKAHHYEMISDITGRYSGYSCEDGTAYYHFSARVVVQQDR